VTYAPWPARTNPRASLLPALGYATTQASSALPGPGAPLSGLQLHVWAALDGIIPYTDAGFDTFEYWYLQVMMPGSVIPDSQGVPDQVKSWWADFYALPACRLYLDAVQRAGVYAGPGGQAALAGPQPNGLPIDIRLLEYTGTFAAAPAPLGGMFPAYPLPGTYGPPAGKSVTDAIIYLKQQANAAWSAATAFAPDTWLPLFPDMPYPDQSPYLGGTAPVDPTQVKREYDRWYAAVQGNPPGTIIDPSVFRDPPVGAPAQGGTALDANGRPIPNATVPSTPKNPSVPTLPLLNVAPGANALSSFWGQFGVQVLAGVAVVLIVVVFLGRKSA